MRRYSLHEICEIVGIDEDFASALVRESILVADVSGSEGGEGGAGTYSAVMLERARVARELVDELEVNLPGAAVIVRLREEMVELRRGLGVLARELERLRGV
jgi:hypothetical protein